MVKVDKFVNKAKSIYYNVIVRWKDNQMKSADSVGADSMWA